MRPTYRVAGLTLVAVALAACTGCMRIGVEVAVAPDGSSKARLQAGLDASLAAMSQATSSSPFSGLAGKQGNWKTREYKDGNWLMTEATGSAGPGESLFPAGEEDTPQLKLQTQAHRLSTRYTVRLQVPPIDPGALKPGGGEGEDEQMKQLVGAMMSTFQVSFTLRGPGRVVATTGKAVGGGAAEWRFGIADLDNKKQPDFTLVTELPNYANLGRLADQLAYTGRLYEAGPKLIAAQERGLLPDPPASTSASEKLQAADYAALLEIIDRLDSAVKPAVTGRLLSQLGLSADDVAPATIAAAHARLMKGEAGRVADDAAAAGLLELLRGQAHQ